MPNKKLKIFIIAGEVSGDVLASKIMREMPGVEFAGIGGENMKSAGLKSLFPISDLAVMGFFEVLAHARTLTKRIRETVVALEKFNPDVLLTVDSPSFAKRVIKQLKIKPKFYHVVAPQVWAWRAGRAKEYAKIFDKLYAFFDFEKPYFEKYGLKTIAVGHPIAEGLGVIKPSVGIKNIALVPGSRMGEVKKLLPVFKEFAEGCIKEKYKFFIPMVETTREYIEKEIKDWSVKPTLVPSSKRYDLFEKTDVAIAASGTVTAELAIMHVPTIVVYKMNRLTEWLARRLIKVKWVSLVNILEKKAVFPELLGHEATAENIAKEFSRIENPKAREKMQKELSAADKKWHKSKPAAKLIAQDIIK